MEETVTMQKNITTGTVFGGLVGVEGLIPNKVRFTKREVKEITGLSIATIDRRREKGHFKNVYMDGGIIFFPREDIVAYLCSFAKASK